MDFRCLITVRFSNSSDFRHCLKSKRKTACFSKTYFFKMCLKSKQKCPDFIHYTKVSVIQTKKARILDTWCVLNCRHYSSDFRQVWISDIWISDIYYCNTECFLFSVSACRTNPAYWTLRRRADPGSRIPSRRYQRSARIRPDCRCRHCCPSQRRQGGLHGIHGSGQNRSEDGCGHGEAGHSGVGRKESQHHPQRCGHGGSCWILTSRAFFQSGKHWCGISISSSVSIRKH